MWLFNVGIIRVYFKIHHVLYFKEKRKQIHLVIEIIAEC